MQIRKRMRADSWSLLFAEIALYTFVVVVVTGIFLAAFYRPDMKRVVYDGSYHPLRDVPVSKAYDSAMRLSFDVRGGLPMRQIHHWAALVFIAAVCFLLMRRKTGRIVMSAEGGFSEVTERVPEVLGPPR
jgi:ubiquinol-cytochrome c reductase cytochrome b subunit